MMTSEKAIQLLHRLQDEQFDGQHGDERREALEMAVRALSGDGDLIYRQDAIDACCFGITHARAFNVETGKAVDLFAESNKELHKAIERIEQLPSAQPTQTNADSTHENTLDCVSRQAAIEFVDCLLSQPCKGHTGDFVEGMRDGYYRIRSCIKYLPSAQPETAKRIVGKSRDGRTLWYQCDMCNEPVDAQDDFCRGCGRRLIDG